MGLKLPQRAVILLVLESDVAYTSLNGHSARKSAVLVLVWCYKATGDREQDLWRLPLKKCELGGQWSSDVAVYRVFHDFRA